MLSEVEATTHTGPTELFSPGSPSVDGKEGTGMQISAIMEAKRHNDSNATLLITVQFLINDHSFIGIGPKAKSQAWS